MMMMRGFGRGGGSSSSSSSSTRCQDCGNQAKRDCAYMRCRTCCKGKGYDCQTHIKSTWLPSVGTKHHHLQTQTLLPPPHHLHLHHYHGDDDGDGDDQHLQLLLPPASAHPQNPRWLREIPSTGFEGGDQIASARNFPTEAILPATLRCIRVRSMENDSATQYAYQAAVSIGGHVFKGVLYDQGAVAEPHQPNLANAHQTLMASTSPAGDELDYNYSHNALPFSALMMPGVDFFQQSSTPKSPS